MESILNNIEKGIVDDSRLASGEKFDRFFEEHKEEIEANMEKHFKELEEECPELLINLKTAPKRLP